MENQLDINKISTSSTLLFMDKHFSQFFTETGLDDPFLATCKQSNLTCCITEPILREEYKKHSINVEEYSDTCAIKIFKVPSNIGTFTEGEDEVIAFLNSKNGMKINSWLGTYDKGAVKKCKESGIKNLNHLDFLILMIQLGKIDWGKAELVYKDNPTYQKKGSPLLKDYYNKNYERINYKLKNLINK